jgi:hypothetical protein
MKKFVCFCFLCLCLGISSYSQETTNLNHYVPVKKGKITLKDGTTVKFKHLKLNDQILNYTDPKGNVIEKNISDVSKIAKRRSSAGFGAIVGGAFTLAIIVDNEIKEHPSQRIESSPRSDKAEYLEFGIFFVGMGALVGSFFKNYKTLYEVKTPISFSPTYSTTPDGRRYAMLSLRFNIK